MFFYLNFFQRCWWYGVTCNKNVEDVSCQKKNSNNGIKIGLINLNVFYMRCEIHAWCFRTHFFSRRCSLYLILLFEGSEKNFHFSSISHPLTKWRRVATVFKHVKWLEGWNLLYWNCQQIETLIRFVFIVNSNFSVFTNFFLNINSFKCPCSDYLRIPVYFLSSERFLTKIGA